MRDAVIGSASTLALAGAALAAVRVPTAHLGPIPYARPHASARATRAVAAIPDDAVVVGAPDETIVARGTLRFVRRVQNASARER